MAINKDFQEELNHELFNQEELMDKYVKELEEKNRHIAELNKHIEKYKKKIFDLTQTNDSSIMDTSQITESKEDLSFSKPIFGDQYQSKYYNALKINNEVKKNELKYQIQFS